MINNFKNSTEIGFINYFPNYSVANNTGKTGNIEKKQEQNEIKDLLIINENYGDIKIGTDQRETMSISTPKEDIKSSVPVNLLMEEASSVELKSGKRKPFGPTNLPTNIEEMYINPRYI